MLSRKDNIRFFLGGDTVRARAAMRRALNAEQAKDPNALVAVFDDLSFDAMRIEEALGASSLFGGRNIVVIDGILGHVAGEEFYVTSSALPRTSNAVFVREALPKKEVREHFTTLGTIEEFKPREEHKKTNNFAVADALLAKDKRLAWAEYVELLRKGVAPEELHGTLFWAVKTILLCKTQTRDALLGTGMKEYTYRKYSSGANHFTLAELRRKLGDLKEMYHAAREESGDLGVLLEQFLLKS